MAKARKSNFLADVWYELTTKVVWPTWGRLRTATIVVVGFIIFWAFLLYGFDSMFTWFQGELIDDEVVQKQWAEIQASRTPAPEGENNPGLPEGMEVDMGNDASIPPGTDQ
jgi:preprotein translocase SecE subunit